jgi:hypothetical protein
LIEAVVLAYLVMMGSILFIYEEQKITDLQSQLDNSEYHYSQLMTGYMNCIARQQEILSNAEENAKWYEAEITKWRQGFYERRPFYIWEQIAWENSISHNYLPNQYDCSQISKELMRLLKQEGYEPVCVYGRTYSQKEQAWVGHDWVELPIYIEATSGLVISPEDLKKNYQIVERGICR